jgi:phage repressor protein C with HTH and peptisase S24 domain
VLSRVIEKILEILRIIEEAENLIESQGFDKSSLAKKLGFPSRYIADIKAGKSKNPGSEFILALINKLNFNSLWLETGMGETFFQKREKSLENPTTAGQAYKIPLLHQKVSCGSGSNWEDDQNIKGYVDVFSLIPRLKLGRLFAFSAQGNSMVGAGIKSGDYVLFDTSLAPQYKDDLYVFSLDGEVYCKQLEFDQISRKVKIYSIRVADLEKAELLTTLNIDDSDFPDRFHICGRVDSWVHPNLEE